LKRRDYDIISEEIADEHNTPRGENETANGSMQAELFSEIKKRQRKATKV